MRAEELMIGDWVLKDMNYSEEDPMYTRADIRRKQRLEILEQFNIVDFCLENYWEYGLRSVDLATAFKALHDKYGWKYAEIHDKFKREIDAREDVYIVRTSDIFLRGAERKQYPIYNNQWFSHMLKR